LPKEPHFLLHALEQIAERKLSRELVEQVLAAPQQILEEGRRRIAQSRYTDPGTGKEYLLRVLYEDRGAIKVVVTAYRTSKVAKYWRQP
jgi:hypothetical protein